MLIVAIGVQRYAAGRHSPDVARYQENIRLAAGQVPDRIGGWVGQEAPVPAQALTVLKPNVMLSRRYVNVENGQTAGVMLVHCSDAHHMVGHFPLRCYPARGWKVQSSKPSEWIIGDLHLTGTEYQFTKESLGGGDESLVVANCLLRPGHRVLRNMEELSATLGGAGGTSSGAGQIQVYFQANVPADQREQAIGALLRGYRPVLDAVLATPGN
jgi:hypothetical protein